MASDQQEIKESSRINVYFYLKPHKITIQNVYLPHKHAIRNIVAIRLKTTSLLSQY